jgi:CDP-diacylglycerol--glycerol-3-phosphate 3-phosphatidyltransferase
MALVPVFILFYYLGTPASLEGPLSLDSPDAHTTLYFAVAAFAVFAIASITDALDGHIARKRSLITNFGKLMDPLADKVLTAAAFVCFVDTGRMAAWMLVVILAREFAITGLRGVAASEGVVIAAGMSGKLKTVLQMSAVLLILLGIIFQTAALGPDGIAGNGVLMGLWTFFDRLGVICLWAAVAVTIWSGVEYLWKGRSLLNAK